MSKLQEYHLVWLSQHPHRNADWLKLMMADGFDIHHLDGDHSNNDPLNLVLMDGADHMMLHNGKKRMSRLVVRIKKKVVEKVTEFDVIPERLANGMLSSIAKNARKR